MPAAEGTRRRAELEAYVDGAVRRQQSENSTPSMITAAAAAVVSGESVFALEAISLLLDRGFPPRSIVLVESPFSSDASFTAAGACLPRLAALLPWRDDGLGSSWEGAPSAGFAAQYVHATLMALGVQIVTGALIGVEPLQDTDDCDDGSASLMSVHVQPQAAALPSGAELSRNSSLSLRACILINAGGCCVDASIAAALTACGLVFDERIVVSAEGRCNDPAIWAGGAASKLSRRYHVTMRMDRVNSREAGTKLADALLRALSPPAQGVNAVPVAGGTTPTGAIAPMTFSEPILRHVCLPGGLHYLHALLPTRSSSLLASTPVGATEISSCVCEARGCKGDAATCPISLLSDGSEKPLPQLLRRCRIVLDTHGRVCELEYLGSDCLRGSLRDLARFVGLHHSALALEAWQRMWSYKHDLPVYLLSPWSTALLLDRDMARHHHQPDPCVEQLLKDHAALLNMYA